MSFILLPSGGELLQAESNELLNYPGQVKDLSSGDRVVPLTPGIGTWREAGIHAASALYKVPKALPLGAAATIVIK